MLGKSDVDVNFILKRAAPLKGCLLKRKDSSYEYRLSGQQ
jgi:hypothetical protein